MKKLFIIIILIFFYTNNSYAMKFSKCFIKESNGKTWHNSFKSDWYEKYDFDFFLDQGKVRQSQILTTERIKEQDITNKKREKTIKKTEGIDFDFKKTEKIKSQVYKITFFDEKFIKAERLRDIATPELKSLQIQALGKDNLYFNLEEGTVNKDSSMIVRGKNISGSSLLIQCKVSSNGSSNYLDYWWAVILIIAITFFIFTQSGKRLKKIRRK